jgi:hypothetical protein
VAPAATVTFEYMSVAGNGMISRNDVPSAAPTKARGSVDVPVPMSSAVPAVDAATLKMLVSMALLSISLTGASALAPRWVRRCTHSCRVPAVGASAVT